MDLRVVGQELPDADPAEDEWDANWLVIETRVSTQETTSWSSRDPSLTTRQVAELVSWVSRVAVGVMTVATPVDGHASTAPPDDDDEPFW